MFLCVPNREKWKAEAKDLKVLEILQAKDYKLQELDQVLLSWYVECIVSEPCLCRILVSEQRNLP